ncbi:MAG TPA: hypothetical protein VGN00_22730 [Puia sp.]|jgi:hypothetical protein
MKNYSINILSEKAIDFPAGDIYLIQSKIELDEEAHFNTADALYLNYPFDEARKIIPFFESLGNNAQKKILKSIQDDYGYKIRVDDLFGKLIVVLFFNIEFYDLLFIGTIGLSDSSINALSEIGRKIILSKKNKTIVLTKTSPKLTEYVSISKLGNE